MSAYAELAAMSNFSFLRGASHPGELVAAAHALGLDAIAIADRNTLSGVVRGHGAAKDLGIRFIPGARLVTTDACEIICYPTSRPAYGRLCRLLTMGNRRGKKAECILSFEEILGASEGQILIAIPPTVLDETFTARLKALHKAAPDRAFLAASLHLSGDDARRLSSLAQLAKACFTPLVAVNDVLYHAPERAELADVLTCIREKCTIAEAGFRLAVNAERHMKSAEEMRRLFADHPYAVSQSVEIAKACRFSLDELKNEYPDEPVPEGKTAQSHLEDLTWTGAARRYPKGVPEQIAKSIKEELAIIAQLDYARYFLTVHDVVAFARSRNILCQGRGSAANSAVCYCLGITAVDPTITKLLFARFISQARKEPPDIDVDFEHERREEVIQYVYGRYGRERAAICSTVIHYRSRQAIREVGKALGLTPDVTAALAKTVWGSYADGLPDEHIVQAGLDPNNPHILQAVIIARDLVGFPRHLSQHVGGFILTRARLDETVPIGNAAMDDRTFIEWDKDDINTLGLMKVDVLALGMLTCISRSFELLKKHYGKSDISLATIPQGDKAVYDMLSKADSIGVFQVESRAQMSMLPRLRPNCFYDLVIEVAIVRPGPIQGDMVHPYLRRRDKLEETNYPSPSPEHGPKNELEEVLKRTLGVPLFQEQAMDIAITAAKFTPDEADGLRRAMATFRHNGTVHLYREKFITGMTQRGYTKEFAERCFGQIEGFGEYGFPESHAASFALLVYISAWIKCHYPDVFCAAILNSQPMGFYAPAQLVRDAKDHDVELRAPDVNFSQWDSTLEPAMSGSRYDHAVRLGFRQVQGLREEEVNALVVARGNGFASLERLGVVANVSRATIERLAEADAFRSIDVGRRQALWGAKQRAAHQARDPMPLFMGHAADDLFDEPKIAIEAMPQAEEVVEDYRAMGLSLKAHPCSFFREQLGRMGVMANRDHRDPVLKANARIAVAGLVLVRQHPGTAKGVVFLTIEDETGPANIIVWPKIFSVNRRTVMTARFLVVIGRLQKASDVFHVVAERFIDMTDDLHRLSSGEFANLKSRDFH
jgi:error-prone DNA polymerase